MRQLIPVLVDPVDPLDVYGQMAPAERRPSVRVNMIASSDGATVVSGVSRALGGPADHELFLVLRSYADVIVVGAGTARSERYGPSRVTADLQGRRRERGQAPVPPIAVVTRSCRLDWDAALFSAATVRPIVITVSASSGTDRSTAARVADVVVAGDDDVDFRRALDALAERGARSVLAEGGPTLNGQLAAAGVVDELCITISPQLHGGPSSRIFAGPALLPPLWLRLASVCEQDDFLFVRWHVTRPAG